jgi:hypothetical protein
MVYSMKSRQTVAGAAAKKRRSRDLCTFFLVFCLFVFMASGVLIIAPSQPDQNKMI